MIVLIPHMLKSMLLFLETKPLFGVRIYFGLSNLIQFGLFIALGMILLEFFILNNHNRRNLLYL